MSPHNLHVDNNSFAWTSTYTPNRRDVLQAAATASPVYELADMAEGNDGAAITPLMHESEDEIPDYHEVAHSDESGLTSPSAFVWALSCTAGISGILFGYDTGVISSTLVSIAGDLGHPLTTVDKSLITSCTSLGALVASPVAGILADKFGRKAIILVADLLFVVGALWQAVSGSITEMIVGRTIVGLAVGGASLVTPLFISELSPSAFRGKLVTLSILFITCGQVVAYFFGYVLSLQQGGWRWMVGLGAVPAFVQLVLMAFLPESPRWLFRAGKTQEARKVLQRVYAEGKDAIVEGVLRAIRIGISEEELANDDVSIAETGNIFQVQLARMRNRSAELFRVGGNRRALTIACLLQGLQQLCGFNSLMYFSASIFSHLDFSSPTLTSLSIAVANFICTLIALLIIDRAGRRRILLLSVPVMIAGLIACAIAYEHLGRPSWSASPSNTANESETRSPWAIVILASMVIYVCGYAIGLGNIAWQQSELFPLSVRSLGSGLATATNWGCNFVVGLTFLPMMHYLTPAWTFLIYSGICAAGWVCAFKIYPETKGLGLEEIRDLLKDSYGVQESSTRGKIRDF